jgi:integrase
VQEDHSTAVPPASLPRSSQEPADNAPYVAHYEVPPKTWEERSVSIPPFVADIIGAHLGMSTDLDAMDLAFTTAAGKPLRSSNFRRDVWLPAIAAIGEEGLRVHELRHTCASLLIATDAHPHHVKEHLGHSSIRVTMDVYGHLYEDKKDEVALRLEDLWTAANQASSLQ